MISKEEEEVAREGARRKEYGRGGKNIFFPLPFLVISSD
jgi:hypothetical protein